MSLPPCRPAPAVRGGNPLPSYRLRALLLLLTAVLAPVAVTQAQTPAAVSATAELAQAEALIEALVQRGLLPRARGDVLIREARVRAGVLPATPPASPARAAPSTIESTAITPSLRQQLREEVRQEVRDELRAEILAEAAALSRKAGETAVRSGQTAEGGAKVSAADPAAISASPAAAAAQVKTAVPPTPETSAQTSAATPSATKPATPAAPPDDVIRVPYVPQVVRDQIRNQVKEDVLAAARAEQWGAAPPPAAWTQRVTVNGDLRVRWQTDRPADDNVAPVDLLAASFGGLTRAADLAAGTRDNVATGSTLQDRERWRLRARLGVQARVNDITSIGLRLSTGSATDRVSTNQTLGQNANRYSFLLEQAFVRVDPTPWASVSAGRIPNPWFASEMQWSDNLAFEGLAGSVRWPMTAARPIEPFLTLGYFPIREDAPPSTSRSLTGAQIGLQWDLARTRLRLALARYQYSGMEGQIDSDYDPVLRIAGPTYGRYEYGVGLRQRGNTLFLTNNPAEGAPGADLTPDRFRWGLASRFAPVALTVAAELSHFAPWMLRLSGEVVHNTAFDRAEIEQRTGLRVNDGAASGVALRAVLGDAAVRQRGQWQVSLGYRRVGSDAVLDAFTDSDLRGGGTNVSGVTAGLLYGLDRDLNLGLRILSGRSLDPTGPLSGASGGRGGYGLDALQVDVGARF